MILYLVLLLAANESRAENLSLAGRHFLVVFAYEGPGNRAVDSHVFASVWTGDNLEVGNAAPPATISWLPTRLYLPALRRWQGRNFSLSETLDWARRNGYRVGAHGPYEISGDLYQRFLAQIRFLDSGAVSYKMINGPFSRGAVNCINAVGDVLGRTRTGTTWGMGAARGIVSHLSPHIVGYPESHTYVGELVGLRALLSR